MPTGGRVVACTVKSACKAHRVLQSVGRCPTVDGTHTVMVTQSPVEFSATTTSTLGSSHTPSSCMGGIMSRTAPASLQSTASKSGSRIAGNQVASHARAAPSAQTGCPAGGQSGLDPVHSIAPQAAACSSPMTGCLRDPVKGNLSSWGPRCDYNPPPCSG